MSGITLTLGGYTLVTGGFVLELYAESGMWMPMVPMVLDGGVAWEQV